MVLSRRFFHGSFLALATILSYLVAIFWIGPRYFASHQIQPDIPFGATLPPTVKAINAFRAEGGVIGEYLVAEVPQMVSIVVAPTSSPGGATLEEFLLEVDGYRNKRELGSTSPPLLQKYTAARIDLRRALKRSESSLAVGHSRIPTLKFTEKGEAWYEIGVGRRGAEQVLILAMRKNEPVDSEALTEALASISIDRSSPNVPPDIPAPSA